MLKGRNRTSLLTAWDKENDPPRAGERFFVLAYRAIAPGAPIHYGIPRGGPTRRMPSVHRPLYAVRVTLKRDLHV